MKYEDSGVGDEGDGALGVVVDEKLDRHGIGSGLFLCSLCKACRGRRRSGR